MMSQSNLLKNTKHRKEKLSKRAGKKTDKLRKELLEICKSCRKGSCCFGGVDVDLVKALKISMLDLDIEKPWFEYLHRDKNLPSGWAVETVVRDDACVFQRKDRRCVIYKIRPRYCVDYPFENGGLARNYKYFCCEADKIRRCFRKEVGNAREANR